MADFTDRQIKVIRFALWQFATAARAQANAAAQDKDGRFFKPGAVDAFLKDAQDAEAILTVLRAEAAHGETPAPGTYEARVKELAPELGMPRAMARADMEAKDDVGGIDGR